MWPAQWKSYVTGEQLIIINSENQFTDKKFIIFQNMLFARLE